MLLTSDVQQSLHAANYFLLLGTLGLVQSRSQVQNRSHMANNTSCSNYCHNRFDNPSNSNLIESTVTASLFAASCCLNLALIVTIILSPGLRVYQHQWYIMALACTGKQKKCYRKEVNEQLSHCGHWSESPTPRPLPHCCITAYNSIGDAVRAVAYAGVGGGGGANIPPPPYHHHFAPISLSG